MKYTAHSMQGKRSHNEDYYSTVETEVGLIAAVFDGHGGDEVSQYCAENFVNALYACRLPELALQKLDDDTKMMDSGSTCSVVAVFPEFVQVLFVGDSPVIVKHKHGVEITKTHNARSNVEERNYAGDRGARWDGYYLYDKNYRGGTGLQCSRSFGDAPLRDWLISTPEILTITEWEWILVATDGILDGHDVTIENPEVQKIIETIDRGAEAEDVVAASPKDDNVTAIVIRP